MRLFALAWFGSALAVFGFVAAASTYSFGPMLALMVAPFAGLILIFWAPYQLREGIRTERWPEAQVSRIRNIATHPGWTAATLLLLLGMVACILTGFHKHRHLYWPIFLVLQTFTQLSNAVRKPYVPRNSSAPRRLDWSEVQPLHSDHWGER